jgi:hypothetical protein
VDGGRWTVEGGGWRVDGGHAAESIKHPLIFDGGDA